MISRIGESLIGLIRRKIVILDLGRRFVKLVVLEKRGQQIRLVSADCVPVPYSRDMETGAAEEALARVLSELVRTHKLKKSSVISSLPRGAVTVKILELPPAEPEKIRSMIEFEAERYIPYSLDRVYYDYQILSRSPGESTKVLLVAVRKGILHRHLSLHEKGGLAPKLVEVDCFANFNSLCRDRGIAAGAVAYLEIGACSSELLVAVEGIPRFTQALSLGGDHFTTAIQEGLNVSRAEAERQKMTRASALMEEPSEDAELSAMTGVIRPVLERFAGEVQNLLDYFRRHPEGVEINQMVLSGGGALLPRIDEFLARRLGIPVIIGEPTNGELSKFFLRRKEVNLPQFAVASGMVMRETNQPVIKLNLVPGEIIDEGVRRRSKERKLIFGLTAGGGIFLLGVCLFLLQFFILDMRLKKVNEQIEFLRPKMGEIRGLNEEKGNYQSAIETVSEFTRGRISWLEALRELSAVAPEGVWLTNLTLARGGTINISGEAAANSSVRDLESALKDSAYFNQVKLTRIDARRNNLVSFHLNCHVAAGIEEEIVQ